MSFDSLMARNPYLFNEVTVTLKKKEFRMVLLDHDKFLQELHKAFTTSKAEKKGSILLSMSRCS